MDSECFLLILFKRLNFLNISHKFNISGRIGKNVAFTLAEVLIVIGIIGIIAETTIPSLINKTQQQENVVGMKKAYSTLSQATELVQQDGNVFSNWDVVDNSNDSVNAIFDYYKPYLRVLKDCGNSSDGCWVQTKGLNGIFPIAWGRTYGIGSNIRVFTLADGMNVSMDIWGDDAAQFFGVNFSGPAISFWFDVNGNKKPNQLGRDVFAFIVDQKGVIPAGTDNNSAYCSKTDGSDKAGFDCAAKVLEEGKMNY